MRFVASDNCCIFASGFSIIAQLSEQLILQHFLKDEHGA
jgi:hypothetical protein